MVPDRSTVDGWSETDQGSVRWAPLVTDGIFDLADVHAWDKAEICTEIRSAIQVARGIREMQSRVADFREVIGS